MLQEKVPPAVSPSFAAAADGPVRTVLLPPKPKSPTSTPSGRGAGRPRPWALDLMTAGDDKPIPESMRLRLFHFVDSVRKRTWDDAPPQVEKYVLQTSVDMPLIRTVVVTADAPLEMDSDDADVKSPRRTPRSPRWRLPARKLLATHALSPRPKPGADDVPSGNHAFITAPSAAQQNLRSTSPSTTRTPVRPQTAATRYVTPRTNKLQADHAVPQTGVSRSARLHAGPAAAAPQTAPAPAAPAVPRLALPATTPVRTNASAATPASARIYASPAQPPDRPTMTTVLPSARRGSLDHPDVHLAIAHSSNAVKPVTIDAGAAESAGAGLFQRRPKSAGTVQRLESGLVSRAQRIVMSYELAPARLQSSMMPSDPLTEVASPLASPVARTAKKQRNTVARLERMFARRLQDTERKIDASLAATAERAPDTSRTAGTNVLVDTARTPRTESTLAGSAVTARRSLRVQLSTALQSPMSTNSTSAQFSTKLPGDRSRPSSPGMRNTPGGDAKTSARIAKVLQRPFSPVSTGAVLGRHVFFASAATHSPTARAEFEPEKTVAIPFSPPSAQEPASTAARSPGRRPLSTSFDPSVMFAPSDGLASFGAPRNSSPHRQSPVTKVSAVQTPSPKQARYSNDHDPSDQSPGARARMRRLSMARGPEDVFGPSFVDRQAALASQRLQTDVSPDISDNVAPGDRTQAAVDAARPVGARRLSVAAQAPPSVDERDAEARMSDQIGDEDASVSFSYGTPRAESLAGSSRPSSPTIRRRSSMMSRRSMSSSASPTRRRASSAFTGAASVSINPATGLPVRNAQLEDADEVIGTELPGRGPTSVHFGNPRPPAMSIGIFRTPLHSPVTRHRKVPLKAAQFSIERRCAEQEASSLEYDAPIAPSRAAVPSWATMHSQYSAGASTTASRLDEDGRPLIAATGALPSWGEGIDTLRQSMCVPGNASGRRSPQSRAHRRGNSTTATGGQTAWRNQSPSSASRWRPASPPQQRIDAKRAGGPADPGIVRFAVHLDKELEETNLFALPGHGSPKRTNSVASPTLAGSGSSRPSSAPPLRPRHIYPNSLGFTDPYATGILRDYENYKATQIHGSTYDPVRAASAAEARQIEADARAPSPLGGPDEPPSYAYSVPTPVDFRIAAVYSNTREQIMAIVRQQAEELKRKLASSVDGDGSKTGRSPIDGATARSGLLSSRSPRIEDGDAPTARRPERPVAGKPRSSVGAPEQGGGSLRWRPLAAKRPSAAGRPRAEKLRPPSSDGLDLMRQFLPPRSALADKRRALTMLARETQMTLLHREQVAQDEIAKSLFLPWRQEGYADASEAFEDDDFASEGSGEVADDDSIA